ncbi:hypothetical protein [Mycobacterium colombiense]|uniref:hypothetical protein n=1 Tax=Mycobacterium colombiense TaxID=339268 RepID=UPI0010577617|nr:hypothetical protein [Mycobacterium colombiense]
MTELDNLDYHPLTGPLIALVALFFFVLAAWVAGYFYKGRHRGEYVEKPEWRQRWQFVNVDPEPWHVTIFGNVLIRECKPVEIKPDTTHLDITVLGGGGGSYGRFGDSDIDLADTAPLWPFLEAGSLGDLEAEGWVDIGVCKEFK